MANNTYHPTGSNGPNWKGESASVGAGHVRANKLYSLDGVPCEGCGTPARDRHHRDHNTLNNEPSNVAFVCRRCHMVQDGRLANLQRYNDSIAYSKGEIIEALRKMEAGGVRATNRNLRPASAPVSLDPIYRLFGSLANARKEAGLEPNPKTRWGYRTPRPCAYGGG